MRVKDYKGSLHYDILQKRVIHNFQCWSDRSIQFHCKRPNMLFNNEIPLSQILFCFIHPTGFCISRNRRHTQEVKCHKSSSFSLSCTNKSPSKKLVPLFFCSVLRKRHLNYLSSTWFLCSLVNELSTDTTLYGLAPLSKCSAELAWGAITQNR